MNLHLPKHTAVIQTALGLAAKKLRAAQGTVRILHSHLGLSTTSDCPFLLTRRNKGESQVPQGLGCPHRKLSSWLRSCCYYQSLHQQFKQGTGIILSPPILLEERCLLRAAFFCKASTIYAEDRISVVSPEHGCAPR